MEEILDHLWDFTDNRVYLLVAIARSKENDEVRATDQPTMRKVVENREELGDKIEQLQHATSRFPQEYRLYATVNGRNAKDALKTLQHELIELDRSLEQDPNEARHKRIDHMWKSILHKPEQRDQKRFLWDVDTPNESAKRKMEELLEGMTVLQQDTPNGYHFVTVPFNFNRLEIPDWIEVERKNDDMIFLGFL